MVAIAETLASIHSSLTPSAEILPPEVRETRFLDGFRQLRAEGIAVIVGADVDKNLAGYAPVNDEIPGLDPRGIVIDPDAREALARMHKAGIPIVISTSRGAAEVSEYLQIPGITIIGSQGLEVRKVDDIDWRKGESKIDPRFEQYKIPMNAMMREVYTRFAAHVSGLNPEEVTLPTQPVFELPINRHGHQEGRVVVQLKGQSEDFPLGIAMAFNVNQPIDGTREDYIARQEEIRMIQEAYLAEFRRIFNTAWAEHFPNTAQENLTRIMSVRTRNETIRYYDVDIPTLDLEIRPGMESGKGHAQVQLMREDDKRQAHFKGAPSAPVTIFSGDSIELSKLGNGGTGQDYAPMRIGSLALKRIGTGGVIGIQTLRPGGSDQAIPGVDIVVDGPAGLGHLLKRMADLVDESGQAA